MKLALVSALAATATALSTYSAGPTGLRTYAPGVNPPAHQRPVPAGAEQGKVALRFSMPQNAPRLPPSEPCLAVTWLPREKR